MPTVALPKFSNPESLRSIHPASLIAFLRPYAGYLFAHGVRLAEMDLDYDALFNLLRRPGADVPPELIDALYLVHECSNDEDADALVEAAEKTGIEIGGGPAPTCSDVAIRVWLAKPELLRDRHAESQARRQRNFFYYAGSLGSPREVPSLTPEIVVALQTTFDDWFEKYQRGRGCAVLHFPERNKLMIVVRHGQRHVREPSHGEDGATGIAYFRPQKCDVIQYDASEDVIGVHAGSLREIKHYLAMIGWNVFGAYDYFPLQPRFTLKPLWAAGEEALNCDDIPGLERIRLVELRRYWGGEHKEVETRKAIDIFAALKSRDQELIEAGRIEMAKFKVKFRDSTKERTLTIKPVASAIYERNEDSDLIERWLDRRGFIIKRGSDAATTAVLEVA